MSHPGLLKRLFQKLGVQMHEVARTARVSYTEGRRKLSSILVERMELSEGIQEIRLLPLIPSIEWVFAPKKLI